MTIVPVRFVGGPFDGLAQGWKVQRALPDTLRMSIELAHARGGIRLEVSDPSACGALLPDEMAPDAVVYRQREDGAYYFERLADEFKGIPVGSA